MLTVKVINDQETKQLANKLGQLLQAGSVLLLEGDLGAGKTTFTKGIAQALGIKRYVKSPTFTLIREYKEGRLPLYHMDVYRLEDGGGDELGLEEYFTGDGVSVVEWPQFIQDLWPTDYLLIKFTKDPHHDDWRRLLFEAHGEQSQQLVDSLAQAYRHE
ncbi:tRNA (adenosine(37)-N6)-threonylcarbamoyltransferase complex ATPase subunit type 1 TsaE [Loigolactobacillus backii]|uniref:tRNA (adenosine(37)-N6)-threonylcarbamoyltransferase complex ATPase subunit type 1 TsaE n=1 Tax=Loigolactobacillus backii TaxID=375175 RepID=UPI000C1CA729|nr:tRNA (adenosine(37)-N6)-threonylcarbamoyltransferase complex ATPase subunit type 1 TsaE [Loigolactobacillus backii]PIO83858.1 tRNA (adenosine(37)-N6)-threonylcarbamoyltransferase complex ATPase subunit type 1 TsaE [Loigolactobacillus backii]